MQAYLDNSATTKPYNEVVDAMVKALTTDFANPSAAYRKGFEVEKNIKIIRNNIAKTLGVEDKSIIFTSGGTESNNAIIRSVAKLNKNKRNHIIVSAIEHPAVLNTVKDLENEGFEITILNVDNKGMVSLEELKNSITDRTCLVSIMYVNNEIGTVEPIEDIAVLLDNYNDIYFHVDAVQAYGKINFKLNNIGIDFMSVSGHKIHGPKGIGFMYIKDVNRFSPLITGGGQEFNIRPGTENVPGIYGMGKAIEILFKDIDSNIESMKSKRNYLFDRISEKIEDFKINTDLDNGVCHILNISFKDIKGEILLHYLEGDDICVSTGSACSSKKKGSHVLNAIGLIPSQIDGAIRFSVSDTTTNDEIDYAVDKLKSHIDTIRLISKRKGR
ncbi:cysteine desulfurase family protein [Peptostreptococcus canis]|uniref:Cysteine desulfurase n=1 Tax=Peptostreptococcus canis TaxID=1159213 RepID=A0ABR6TJF6_9FIRM|nr:cysteine desulfurase family protein [Peptostreptococcus canis]MBC2575363.1 cysteine desulfurase [Peptostreptococcus canis]MBP1997454.1 cysteine desulfurase [Peptostreptococcus canis]